MKPALPDVNILIALLDLRHAMHDMVQDWFSQNHTKGWATCPITENGLVRIISQPAYPEAVSVAEASALLSELKAIPGYAFWQDSISLLDPTCFHTDRLTSSRHVTDTYLLGLAKAQGGVLATLDARLQTIAVVDGANYLLLLA